MTPLLAIARREFRSYFDSPLAYVVICLGYAALGGVMFLTSDGFWQMDRTSMQPMFENAPLGLALLVVPVLTMRLLAEERRSGTLEMLITLPVRDSDVIIGKYLGALGLVTVLVGATLLYPVAMFQWPWHLGSLDWGPVWSGYLGLFLFSAAVVALGLLVSSLTESQPIAFFVTFLLFLSLMFLDSMARFIDGPLGNILTYVSFRSRLEGFNRGLIDTRDLVYFASITLLSLVLAFRALERRKWA